MAEEDLVELKFRLADGTDIVPTNCSPNTSVGSLKERIVAQWPKEKLKDDFPKKNRCLCTIL